MAPQARLKRFAPFLILPILWFILAFAVMEREPSAHPGSYEFIPFALEAASSADYSPSTFAESLAPIGSDIILQALRDQMAADGQKPTATVSEPPLATQATEPSDEDEPASPAPTEVSPGRGQGNGGQGNGNGKGNRK